MSTNSNFKKDKCWSCEYYCGKREYKKGVFLGDSVYTDGSGTCGCKRSEKYGKTVTEDRWCSRYQKWGVLQSALAIEEQKRESQRIENEQRREMQRIQDENDRQRREIDRERRRLAEEREQLEREEKLSEMTPEEREEFLRKENEAKEAERAARLLREKESAISRKKNEIAQCKKTPVKPLIVGAVISLIAFLLGWIPYWYFDSALKDVINEILECEKKGYDPNGSYVQMLYHNGLALKEARNNSVWVPIVFILR